MSYSSDGRGLDVAHAPASDERRALNLRPLAGLVPYIVRYRGRAASGACRTHRCFVDDA